MSTTLRAASEAAAWAFAGVFLALASIYVFGRVSVSMGEFAALATTLGLVGGFAASIAVVALVRGRVPGRYPVVGGMRGAGIGVLVVVIVPAAAACFDFGSDDLLYRLFGLVWWSVVVAGLPFAVAGAVLGRSMERRLFRPRGG